MFFCPCFFISIYVVCLMVGELLVKHLTFHCVSVDRTSTLWWTLLLLWRKKESVYFALIFLEMGKPLVLKGQSILFGQCLDKGIAFYLLYQMLYRQTIVIGACGDSKVPCNTDLTRGQCNGSKSKILHHYSSNSRWLTFSLIILAFTKFLFAMTNISSFAILGCTLSTIF